MPKGTMLFPLLFLTLINELPGYTQSYVCLFAGGIEISDVKDRLTAKEQNLYNIHTAYMTTYSKQ